MPRLCFINLMRGQSWKFESLMKLNRDSTSSILELVQNEGARVVTRKIEFYNLDVIISVGYRVNTKQGIAFRQWATSVLRQHLLQGYSINRQLVAFQEHVDERFVRIEDQLKKHEEQISFFVRTNQPPHEGVVFQGKLLEGREVAEALIKSAKRESLQANHEAEYGTDRHIEVLRYRTDFHDRFLIIDDDVYHFGASLKDLGKRLFAFEMNMMHI